MFSSWISLIGEKKWISCCHYEMTNLPKQRPVLSTHYVTVFWEAQPAKWELEYIRPFLFYFDLIWIVTWFLICPYLHGNLLWICISLFYPTVILPEPLSEVWSNVSSVNLGEQTGRDNWHMTIESTSLMLQIKPIIQQYNITVERPIDT